jgi:3-hydroxybutyryl-CoA dehydrogenase
MANVDTPVTTLEDLLGDMSPQEEGDKIELVSIIGGGVMGQGIAQTVARSGIDVIIVEKNDKFIEESRKTLKKSMEYEITRWSMTDAEMKSILKRITWTLEFEECKDSDIVIEAVDENFQLKRLIFKKLDEIVNPDAIFVSNTSTLSVTQIADITERKDKMLGMHFLHPVPKIPLVELIRALETSDETILKAKSFAAKIGKTPVEVYEYPGFVTTRVIVPYLNEAMYVLLEGVASAKDIDTAMKLGYNINIGPLEMADAMGLDEVLNWMTTLWSDLGEPRYRPCPILRKLVRDRKLGKKTGEGFFKYDSKGKIIS